MPSMSHYSTRENSGRRFPSTPLMPGIYVNIVKQTETMSKALSNANRSAVCKKQGKIMLKKVCRKV